jgi:hypothetical protein
VPFSCPACTQHGLARSGINFIKILSLSLMLKESLFQAHLHLLVNMRLGFKSIQEQTIEIGLEQAPFVYFILFFSAFEHVKSLLIMGPNNTENSSLKCDFLIINYE